MSNRLHITLISSGILVWLMGLGLLGVLWITDPPEATAAAATIAAFLLTGKIPAILAGYALGGSALTVGLCVLLPDLGTVLVLYPFTHHGLNFLGRISKYLETQIAKARAKAENQQGIVSKRGSLGLLVLSLLPGGLYSPVVVMLVGQLNGLNDLQVLAPIIFAQIVMVAVYTWAIFTGLDIVGAIDPRIPWLISLAVVAILVSLAIRNWLRWRRARARAAAAAPERPPAPPS